MVVGDDDLRREAMTLDEARHIFEAHPTRKTGAQYLGQLLDYAFDYMIDKAEYEAECARVLACLHHR